MFIHVESGKSFTRFPISEVIWKLNKGEMCKIKIEGLIDKSVRCIYSVPSMSAST